VQPGILAMVGGLASLGINAKDSNVTGGTVVQPGIPVAPVPTAVSPPTPSVSAPVAPQVVTKSQTPNKW